MTSVCDFSPPGFFHDWHVLVHRTNGTQRRSQPLKQLKNNNNTIILIN